MMTKLTISEKCAFIRKSWTHDFHLVITSWMECSISYKDQTYKDKDKYQTYKDKDKDQTYKDKNKDLNLVLNKT